MLTKSFLRGSVQAALFCLIVLTAPARADFVWGVNGHPFAAYPGISFTEQLDLVQDLGMTSYRVDISALDRADELAELLAEAKPRGIDILPVISPPFDLDAETAGALYDKSYDMAVKLVSRFKDDIRVWELGNEMENYAIITACEMRDDGSQYDCSWGPAGGDGVSHYFTPRWAKVSAVLRGLSDGVMAVDPTIRKAMGTAGWGHTGAFDRMQDDGIKWDISVWHHYGADLEWALEHLGKFSRPIWITEFNSSSEQGERHQADVLLEMMGLLQRHRQAYDIEAAHIYELLDEPYWAPSFEAVMGLVRLRPAGEGLWTLDGSKAAYDVARDFIANDLQSETDPEALESGTAPAAAGPLPCEHKALATSVANHANQVVYGYCLLLQRMPTPHEQWGHAEMLRGESATPLAMLTRIMDTAEFRGAVIQLESPAETYVGELYRLLLEREADGIGLSDYISRLDEHSLTRSELAVELMQSDEFSAAHPIFFAAQNR